MKVEQFYNKNQFVIYTKEKTVFQSYNSTICVIENEKVTFGKDWDYSNTTQKHLYLFLKDYCYSIYRKIAQSKNKREDLQKMIDNKEIILSNEF